MTRPVECKQSFITRRVTTKLLVKNEVNQPPHTLRIGRKEVKEENKMKYEYSKTIEKGKKKQQSWIVLDNDELIPGEKVSGRLYCVIKKPIKVNKILVTLERSHKSFNGIASFPR